MSDAFFKAATLVYDASIPVTEIGTGAGAQVLNAREVVRVQGEPTITEQRNWRSYIDSKVASLVRGRAFGTKPAESFRPRKAVHQNDMVYFVLGSNGLIKIGHSVNVRGRMSALRCEHGGDLRLLLVLSGGRPLEAEMHHRFSSFRNCGEWFYPSEPLLAFIEENFRGEEPGSVPKKQTGLTDRQALCLDTIRNMTREKGFPPSMRELAAALGLKSTTSVFRRLRSLERKGLIQRPDRSRSRALRPMVSPIVREK